MGMGCGAVRRAVTSNTKNPWFKVIFINCQLDGKDKTKEKKSSILPVLGLKRTTS